MHQNPTGRNEELCWAADPVHIFLLVSFVSFSLRFRCYFSLLVFRFLLCIRGKIDAVKVKLQKKHMEKRHDDMKIFGFICKQLLILISAGNINSFYSVLNEHLFKRKQKNFEPVFTRTNIIKVCVCVLEWKRASYCRQTDAISNNRA